MKDHDVCEECGLKRTARHVMFELKAPIKSEPLRWVMLHDDTGLMRCGEQVVDQNSVQ